MVYWTLVLIVVNPMYNYLQFMRDSVAIIAIALMPSLAVLILDSDPAVPSLSTMRLQSASMSRNI